MIDLPLTQELGCIIKETQVTACGIPTSLLLLRYPYLTSQMA